MTDCVKTKTNLNNLAMTKNLFLFVASQGMIKNGFQKPGPKGRSKMGSMVGKGKRE